MQADGRYNSHTRAASTRAKIDILPNIHKAADAITNSCEVTQRIEIGAGWTRRGETSGNDYVSLSIAAPRDWAEEALRQPWQSRGG